MKSTIISMIIVLMVMVAVPMIFLGDGNLAERLGFGGFGGKEKPPAKLPKNIKAVITDKRVEVYTWVDEHGIKQFSNVPPQDGRESEMIVLSPNTNIIDAVKIPEQKTAVASTPKVYSIGNPYTPGGMKQVIDNSKDVQEMLNLRQAEQEQMMQELFPQMNADKHR